MATVPPYSLLVQGTEDDMAYQMRFQTYIYHVISPPMCGRVTQASVVTMSKSRSKQLVWSDISRISRQSTTSASFEKCAR